jgi:hypothetical protein
MKQHEFIFQGEAIRLDKYLVSEFQVIPYSNSIIDRARASIGQRENQKSNFNLKNNDVVVFTVPDPVSDDVVHQDIPLDIITKIKT